MIYLVMVGYQLVIVFIDFIYLIIQCFYLFILSMYQLIDPPKLKSVVGEIVMITGTGHGIGKELAVQFSRLGAKVVCLDINENWNENTVAQISKEGGTAWAFTCDVSREEEVQSVSEKVRQVAGDVTILVNNAGIMTCKSFIHHSKEDIEYLFGVNVLSHFWTIKEWLPIFQKNGRGHIVAISSVMGTRGTPNLVPYSSSKYAVTGLMESLLEELRYGNQNPGIRLTTIHPFFVKTGLAKKPRFRFRSVIGMISPEKCAELIIESVRREEEIAFVPSFHYYLHKTLMVYPRKIQQAVYDFIDSGVDPDDE